MELSFLDRSGRWPWGIALFDHHNYLINNDVAGVAPLLQVMLHLKCLIDNSVAGVAPFLSYIHIALSVFRFGILFILLILSKSAAR
jgi:hypothetical protein